MRRWAALLVLSAGLAVSAAGAWIPAKAFVAQRLLENAWQRARVNEPLPRPWPWADMAPIARLQLPAYGTSRIVLAGATGASLAFGPGHLHGTAAPGSPGNSVLFGHRDTHFAILEALEPGDAIDVETRDGRTRRYRVAEGFVVDEAQTGLLEPGGPTRLTLITCYPFDAAVPGGPLRYVVIAELDAKVPASL